MGALVEAERNGEKGAAKSCAEKICASNPVVYQLVRVEVDGRLVPATDDELMEVEHLLEDDSTKLQAAEIQRHTEKCASSEWLLPKTSTLEGHSHSEGMEVDSQNINAGLENADQEERLRLKCASVNRSPMGEIVSGTSADHLKHSESCDDELQPQKTSIDTVVNPIGLNDRCCVQPETAQTASEPANDAVASRSSISETCSSSGPDFSILKGELCLDNLTIRELQKVFWATFGRQTSVKDKLWLKRRITMGLTNSCEVPTTGITIKNNKVVWKEPKEESCGARHVISEANFLLANHSSSLINDNIWDSPNSPTNQMKDQNVSSGKRQREPLLEFDMKNENIQMERCATKRTRKPTKRYIEELSDFEARECTGRMVYSVKDSEHYRVYPKPQVQTLCDSGSHRTTFVTRKDSIGGCGIQIPYVSRMRRGRPRTDFYALMNFGGMENDKRDTQTSCGEEQDLDHDKINLAGDSLDNNHDDTMHHDDTVHANNKARTLKVGVKRKHHRAWTLCEVLKLVEGVARYGAGRWSEIRRVAFASFSYRTSVDLKDKWRNLIRASFAQEPSDKGAKNFRKPTSVPIPAPILLRVRELAEMHSQAGIEFGPSKFAVRDGQTSHLKGSGFL